MAPTARELGVSINCATCDNQIRLGDETCGACKRVVTSDEVAALRRRWEAADPLAAMIAGLTVYVLLELVAAFVSIVSLAQGVLVKFLVIAALITGISAERQLRKHQKP